MDAQQQSSTALVIAKVLSLLALDPKLKPLVPPASAEAGIWFADAACSQPGSFRRQLHNPIIRLLARMRERLTVPGIFLHYLLRKLWIEQEVRQAMADGAGQVICLGAGYDMLSSRLAAEHPACSFMEVDAPGTQAVKQRALMEHGVTPPNLHFVGMNLAAASRSLREQWVEGGARDDLRTFFIAEGLLMYLDDVEVARLLAAIRDFSRVGSRFVFTCMTRLPGGKVRFKDSGFVLEWWLRQRGEPFKWGIPPGEMPHFLQSHEFLLRRVAEAPELRNLLPADPALRRRRLAEGEYVVVAEALGTDQR